MLADMANAVEDAAGDIAEANAKDLEIATRLVAAGELSLASAKRLELGPEKLAAVVQGIRQVASLPDPLGKVLLARELDEGLVLRQITCPIGVIGVIFESRPDALPQIISLCIKSGNAALLKGGREAKHTNAALFEAIQSSLQGFGDAFVLLKGRTEVAEMLKADGSVDLIIPRGSNELVRYVMDNTHIPVLGHAAGICHVYVDAAADVEKAVAISVDSKATYPSACNAAETILIHASIAATVIPLLFARLSESGVEIRADRTSRELGSGAIEASDADFGHEFADMVVAVKVVDNLNEAIGHINRHSSHHTDTIVTEDRRAAAAFLQEVDSAGVFHNASTRFADGFRYGFGAEVGISNGKMHPRGPVGLEGLITYKYKLVGNGHIVAQYSGPNARKFTHRDL